MQTVLISVFLLTSLSLAAGVREWKNFENGKVYSRKMTPDKKATDEVPSTYDEPAVEERFLHSHHKDKNKKVNAQQSVEVKKPIKTKNAERHHRKSVEEEMHLRPLNERHHKFPNPELLDKSEDIPPPSKVSRHTLLQQGKLGKQNHRRSRGGKRLKRNKLDKKISSSVKKIPDPIPENKTVDSKLGLKQEETKKSNNIKPAKVEPMQFSQIRKDGFPIQQTSYW